MSGGWLETVAAKAGVRPTEAELALRKRGITADRPLRAKADSAAHCLQGRETRNRAGADRLRLVGPGRRRLGSNERT